MLNMQNNKSKYKSHLEWKKVDPHAYRVAVKSKKLRDICEHFGWPPPKVSNPKNYWTKKRVFKTLKGYDYYGDWVRECSGAHNAARKNGWLNELDEHMKWNYRRKVTKLGCINNYKKHGQNWKTEGGVYYRGARDNGWLLEITGQIIF